MEEKTNSWKIAAIVFIFLFAISLLGIWSISSSASDQAKAYSDNYEYKCPEGTTKECVYPDQQVIPCKKDYSTLCFDNRLQTGVVCNKADDTIATCVPEDTKSWITCADGYIATCGKEDRWGVWTGDYTWSCSLGETAYCQ